MFDPDEPLPWDPCGLSLSYAEWEYLVSWYIQKSNPIDLDNKENTLWHTNQKTPT
jgi:hypothetical protein